jgi:MoaA/NifB/PqqE/SkfB family radical SAM enzyme/polysaccharide pyruvyl transferase WcaK-like protein
MNEIIKKKLTQKQINKIKTFILLLNLAKDWLKTKIFNNIFPVKPITLNLLINDVCNSRCQMCLIWKNKKDKELNAEELQQILSDSLFKNLQYIGVSGGEPTLRNDLQKIFEVICSKTPKLKGVGIITNGIIENVVKEKILECAEICQKHGITFNIMISLDGLGEIHDISRGREKNFQSAISLLKFFHKETNIPTSFGCTITTSNALYVDELLDFAKAEGLYGRFRIAEFIKRLYNQDRTEFIRAFDEKISYHLGLFFFRLEHDFEQNLTYQKTYKNIRSMIADKKPRQIGCPYQSNAVVLTSRGDLLYCSPKSPILGNALKASAKEIYLSNLEQRQKIIKNDCSNCIHDYHESVTFPEMVKSKLEQRRINKRYDCSLLLKQSQELYKDNKNILDISKIESARVLIVGWYGTETAGDKAILWSIVNRLYARPEPPKQIYLSSLYPFISQWTLKEMRLVNVSIVETYSREFERLCNQVDEIVVGGGPLMDIEPLNHILYAFIQATKAKTITRIEGCGIGPLSSPLYTKVVSEIVRLSNHITLRDSTSTKRVAEEFVCSQIKTVNDPATDYVEHVKTQIGDLENIINPLCLNKNVSCFLREWGKEYAGHLEELEYTFLKKELETQLVELITFVAQVKDADIHLLPMHTFHVGGDDRVFNRYLAKNIEDTIVKYGQKLKVDFTRQPISPLQILQSMYHAQFNICMRFHSVLFAETLGVPYLAIDYTEGGKIKAFLEDKGKLNRLISLTDIAKGNWKDKINKIL